MTQGWTHGGALVLGLVLSLALIPGADAQAPAPNTLPAGGQVTAGQASISQSGSQLTVNQGSASAIINWQSFSIGSQAAVQFNQPGSSSVALNRVVTGIPSQIFGRLTANGQVFLVNPGGILFGPGAQLNVGGMVATTMAIKDSDFLAGAYVFNRDGATAAVENQGVLTAAPGGMVALLASTVVNQGTIAAPGGAVVLAAGETIDLAIGAGVSVQASPATVQTLIDNRGLIAAAGGRVILTSQAVDAVLGGAINNSGVIEAGAIHDNGGTVTLDASGTLADSGAIDTSGAKTGGTVTLAARNIKLASARISATGGHGGGSIALGGSATQAVSVDSTSTLDASALTNGNGGAIYVYGRTDAFAGKALAKGGAEGGNGGQVETSGETLDVAGARVDTSAPMGRAGNWLLDPFDLTVDAATAITIANDLALTNVTVKTTATTTSGPGTVSAGAGDITVASAISAPLATNSLTLSAFHDVNVNATITTGGAVTLQADNAIIEGGTVNYGLGGAVVAGGGLTAYSGTGSSEAPTNGTLLDDTSSTTTTAPSTAETTTSTDPLATPLVEVSDSSLAGTEEIASTIEPATETSTTTETAVTTGETTATVGTGETTSTTEPTVETSPTETTVTAGETTATIGGTENTTGSTTTTTETTTTAGETTGTGTTGETSTTTEPTVETTPSETTVTTGETTATVGTGETTSTTEPTVETSPTETTVTAGETTATVGGTETTTTTPTEPTVEATPTETTVTTGETTATVGTGSTTTPTESTVSTTPTEPTVETSPTETTVTTGETTATIGTGTETTTTTEPTVSTTPTETTVTAGETTATVGTGGGGNGQAGAQGPMGNAAGGAAQTANLPPMIKHLRLLHAAHGSREATRVVAEIGDASRGFRFALPDNVTRDAHGSIAELAGGRNLPVWLTYHPEDFSFTARAVPAGGLPVTVVVTTVRPDGTTHRISVAIRP